MSLEFRPPTDLVNAYLSRPSPGQEASQGIQQALKTYVEQKANEHKQKNEAFKSLTDMAGIDPTWINSPIGQQKMKEAGIHPEDFKQPGPVQSPQVGAPELAQMDNAPVQGPTQPMQGPPLPGVGMGLKAQQTPASGVGAPSLIERSIAHHFRGGGVTPSPTPTSQAPVTQPPSMFPDLSTLSDKELTKHGKLGAAELTQRKTLQGMDINDPASFDETTIAMKAAGHPELADELIKNAKALGQTTVQRKSLDSAMKGLGVANTGIRGSAIDSMAETRRQQLHLKTAEDYEKSVNPATASGGSLVGIAGRANARADRALQVLRSDKMTFQDLSTVVADISGIFQGGVPHEQSLRDQHYGTALEKLASFQTYVTGNPSTGMVPSEIKAKLKQVITDVKRVDNKVIEDNMRSKRNVFKSTSWSKENPTAIDDIEGNIRSQYLAAGENEGSVTIRDSQGGMHTLPSDKLEAAKQRDPGLQVIP